ncbi:MAG: winged helix-turn-helix transcriptional regulator [Streptosporangiales bacterium]
MRSYRQYCALARALDVVGERWTLLIIRELFARDSRYADLRDSLPGIASNLLADRLRQLQTAGLIEAYDAPRPVRATVYRLTARGRELGPVLRALVAWGAPLVGGSQGEDAFRTHWLALGLPAFFDGVDVADLAPLTVYVRTGDAPATLRISGDALTMDAGAFDPGEDTVVVDGDPDDVLALLSGRDAPGPPEAVEVSGPADAIRRLHTLASRSRVAT